MLLMETKTAGRSNSDGSCASSPVSGFAPVGKSPWFGPSCSGGRCGCGVAVNVGEVVEVAVAVDSIRVGIAPGDGDCGALALHDVSAKKIRVAMVLARYM